MYKSVYNKKSILTQCSPPVLPEDSYLSVSCISFQEYSIYRYCIYPIFKNIDTVILCSVSFFQFLNLGL